MQVLAPLRQECTSRGVLLRMRKCAVSTGYNPWHVALTHVINGGKWHRTFILSLSLSLRTVRFLLKSLHDSLFSACLSDTTVMFLSHFWLLLC